MDRLIINCDLGEDETTSQTRALLSRVDAASVGCGVHAGSEAKTLSTLREARGRGLLIGAHPGLATAGGRGAELPTVDEFRDLLREQAGAFRSSAENLEVAAAYMKLHGSLYHAVEADSELSGAYLEFLKGAGQGLGVFSLAGGSFAKRCRASGIPVYAEAFADRAYCSDGSLLPRGQPVAVLSAETALGRLRYWLATGNMPSHDGQSFPLKADTLCVHGDSPGALQLLEAIRAIV